MSALRKLRCAMGNHCLHVVHRFGAGALIACPHCEREWGVHDGLRAFVAWDGDLEELYEDMGHDIAASRAEWRRLKRPYPPNQIGSYALDAAPADGLLRATNAASDASGRNKNTFPKDSHG